MSSRGEGKVRAMKACRSAASATSTPVLSGGAKSFTPAGRVGMPYAACSVVGVDRVLVRRFCSIKGSSTSPQLMHRKTVPSVAYSGRDSAIIKPLHFLHVIPHLLLFTCIHTSANLAMED